MEKTNDKYQDFVDNKVESIFNMFDEEGEQLPSEEILIGNMDVFEGKD